MCFGRKGKDLSGPPGSVANPGPPLSPIAKSTSKTTPRLKMDLSLSLPRSEIPTPVNLSEEDIATIQINDLELFYLYGAANSDIQPQFHPEIALPNTPLPNYNYVEARLNWNYNPSIDTADTVSQTIFTDISLTPIHEIFGEEEQEDWASVSSEWNRPGARVTVRYIRPPPSPASVETKRLIVIAYQSIRKLFVRIIHCAPDPPKEPSTPHPRLSPYPPSVHSEAKPSTFVFFQQTRATLSRAFYKMSSLLKIRRNSS